MKKIFIFIVIFLSNLIFLNADIKINSIVEGKKGSKVNFYEYGRGGSQTTIALQNVIAELELAHATFLTSTGFGAVALAILSICRPGDEIVVTDAVYAPTRIITSKLLKLCPFIFSRHCLINFSSFLVLIIIETFGFLLFIYLLKF